MKDNIYNIMFITAKNENVCMTVRGSLLSRENIIKPLEGTLQNTLNGSDSESFAMSMLILACRGEGHWGSREEDNSKIDMIFSFEHPWAKNERLTVLTQVKSGESYGKINTNGFTLKRPAKKLAYRTTHHICVIWVDRKENRAFWAYIHPDTTKGGQDYGGHHEISPCTIYDLARCMSLVRKGNVGGKGITIKTQASSLTERRKIAKSFYSKTNNINSPVLGKVELTRIGWRHMFRSGRSSTNKDSSLNIIPYLNIILIKRPSTHAITSNSEFKRNGYSYQIREHLLKYEDIKAPDFDKQKMITCCAHIRLVEEIRFPQHWKGAAMLSQLVQRRVVLKSAYYK